MAISFLTLPGELREQIYVEALTFDKDTLRCTVQLLRTCKQIYGEASKYLFDNIVDVQVWSNGVYAQNNRCGIYSPQTCLRDFETRKSCWRRERMHKGKFQVADFTMIAWPSFLRKFASLRFSLRGEWDFHHQDRLIGVENVWFSLCSFLHRDHKLQFVDIDMHRHEKDTDCDEPKTSAIDLWPVRALGDLRELSIRGVQDVPDMSRTNHDSLPDITSIEAHELAIVRSNDALYIDESVSSSNKGIDFAKSRLSRRISGSRLHLGWHSTQHPCATCEGVLFADQLDIFEAETTLSCDQRTNLTRYCINIRRAMEIYPLPAKDILMHSIAMLLRAELEGHYIDQAYRKIRRERLQVEQTGQRANDPRRHRQRWICMS